MDTERERDLKAEVEELSRRLSMAHTAANAAEARCAELERELVRVDNINHGLCDRIDKLKREVALWNQVAELARALAPADAWREYARNDHVVLIDHKDEMDLAELAIAAIEAAGEV